MNGWTRWPSGRRAKASTPISIVFTEFGAMKQTIDGMEIGRASRARWLRDTSASIESRGWGWTAYVLRDDPFGLYVHESDRNPDPESDARAAAQRSPLSSPAGRMSGSNAATNAGSSSHRDRAPA